MEAALIFDNPHSDYTMEALRASWGQVISAQSRALNETENQILIRDSKGLSQEQMAEYRKSFNYFDKVGVFLFFVFLTLGGSLKTPLYQQDHFCGCPPKLGIWNMTLDPMALAKCWCKKVLRC